MPPGELFVARGHKASHSRMLLGLAMAWLAVTGNIDAGAATPRKIYISADMEGIGGVVSRAQTGRDQPEYSRFRELMTQEVNAAIEGALAAGATQIVVSDSHGEGENLLVEKLHPAASLERSFPRPLDMMQGIDSSFDAVLLIGYHAAAGTPDAILPHTLSGRISSLKVNGVNLSEGGVSAAIAGHFGVPVALVSGDQATIEEMRRLMGPVTGAQVKVAHGAGTATTLHPSESCRLIREKTREALGAKAPVYKVKTPITLELEFKTVLDAEILAFIPGIERTSGTAVKVQLQDMVAVARFINVVMYVRPPGS